MAKAKPRPDPKYCGAETPRGKHDWCHQPAGAGTDHVGLGRCNRHGGASPNGKKRAAIEHADQIRRTMIGDGYDVEGIDPGMILLEELARTAAVVRWLESEIAGSDERQAPGLDPGRAGYDQIGSAVVDIETTQGGLRYRPNIYVSLWQREREHLAKVAKDCLAVGLKEREVKLAEQQGELVFRIFNAVIADSALNLTATQKVKAPAVIRKHLSLVALSEEDAA